jgi:signal transduction histidine kinase
MHEPVPPIRLVRDVESELPNVPMDVRLIRQAILNVVLNAIQAMPSGGDLKVVAKRDAGGGAAWVTLEIGDTGAGIPPDVQPRIFEPFYTTKATGTGLGLAVVKRIVDGHHGEVTVTSRAGAGTVVRIRLPIDAPG